MKAFVEISTDSENEEAVVNEIERMKEIESVTTIREEFNIVARLHDESFSQLNLILETINRLEGVRASKPVLIPT
ncbi:MAG: Lrp/AsnC ligand binding domain-containing protein [Candidatus Thorarchaeota archaeon]